MTTVLIISQDAKGRIHTRDGKRFVFDALVRELRKAYQDRQEKAKAERPE